jgi:hypothetical protein
MTIGTATVPKDEGPHDDVEVPEQRAEGEVEDNQGREDRDPDHQGEMMLGRNTYGRGGCGVLSVGVRVDMGVLLLGSEVGVARHRVVGASEGQAGKPRRKFATAIGMSSGRGRC